MRNKISTALLIAALTIPLSMPYALAQDSIEDITSYSQSIQSRLDSGRTTGRLTPSEINELQGTYDRIQAVIRAYGNKKINSTDRASIMRSLTQLDQQVTDHLHDNENSRYQYWDSGHNSWNQKWWQPGWTNNSATTNRGHGGYGNQWREKNREFIAQVEARKNQLRERMERGRTSGQLSGHELRDLDSQFDAVEGMQRRMMADGLSDSERNSLMQMLDNLDRNISAEKYDNDRRGAGLGFGRGEQWRNQNKEFVTQVQTRKNLVRDRIQSGQRSGQLSPQQLQDLQSQLNRIDSLQNKMMSDGLNDSERTLLMQLLDNLDRNVTAQMQAAQQNAGGFRGQWRGRQKWR